MPGHAIMAAALLVVLLAAGASAEENDFGRCLGRFRMTYYWIVFEKAFQGRPSVPLYTTDGKVIAVVADAFAKQVSMEGTGVLRDGRVVNLHLECKPAKYGWCFLLVDKKKAPFGYGSHAPLHPFRTLAVPEGVVPRGSVVYIPAFDGMPLPGAEGGFEYHDGCFVVEDTGWSLNGKHLDVFALSEAYYRALHKRVDAATHVDVYFDSPFCPKSAEGLKDPETWARELLSSEPETGTGTSPSP